MNAAKNATNHNFAKRSESKLNFFFAQKLPDLAPVLNILMQLKRVTDGT